jgi:hypothetical protein
MQIHLITNMGYYTSLRLWTVGKLYLTFVKNKKNNGEPGEWLDLTMMLTHLKFLFRLNLEN